MHYSMFQLFHFQINNNKQVNSCSTNYNIFIKTIPNNIIFSAKPGSNSNAIVKQIIEIINELQYINTIQDNTIQILQSWWIIVTNHEGEYKY